MNIFDLSAKISLDDSGFKSGIEGAKKSMEDLGKGSSGVSETLKKGFTLLGGAAVAAGGAILKSSVDAAYYADDLNTLSKQTGIATDTLQKFAYASDLIDVSQEAVTGSLKKLTMNMDKARKGGEDQTAAFEALGVAYEDANGEFRDNEDVFYDLIDALGQIQNSTERDALAMSLFGKSAQDLNPLILGGSEALQELGQQAEDAGLIMSQGALDGLNQLSDALDTMKATIKPLSNIFSTEFAPAIADVISKVTEFAPQVTEAVSTLASTVSGKFGDIKTAIETAAGDLEGPIEAFKELFSGQILNGVREFASGVGDLFAAFQSAGASVISAAADSIGQFIDAFKESSIGEIIGDIAESAGNLFDAFKSAGETVIQGVATAVSNFMELFDESLAISTLESIAAAVKKFFEPFSETLGSAIEKVSSALSSVLGFLGDFAGVLTNEIVLEVKELADNFEKWAPWVAAVAAGFVTMQIVTKVSAGFTALTTALQSGQLATQLMSVAQAALNAVMNANPIMLVVSAIAALVTGLVVAYNTNEDFRNAVDAAWAAIKQAAEVTFEALKTFFTEKVPAAFNALKEWFAGLPDTFKTIGHNIVEGIKNGFTAAWESFKSTVSNLVNGIVDGVKGFLGIGSPSKVFAEIGKYTVQGMEVGWNREFDTFEDMVGSDMSSLSSTARIGFEDSAIGRSSAAGITSLLTANSGASSQPVEVNLVLDGEVAAKVLYDPLRNVAWQKGKAEAVYA